MGRKNLDNHHKKKRKSESSAERSDSGSVSGDEDSQGTWSGSNNSSYSSSRSASASSASGSHEEKRSKKDKKGLASNKPTKEKVRTVEYHVHYNTTPSERYDSNGDLKHKGDIVLTLANGRLSHGTVINKNDVNANNGRVREMVTAVRVKNLVVEGITQPFNLELPTVGAYKDESFCGKQHFCKRIHPSQATFKKPYNDTFTRNTSEAATDYQKKFGLDASNFSDHVVRPKNCDFSLVPLNSPVIAFKNADPATKKQTKHASKGLEKEKLVKMDRKEEEKYSEQALKQISQKMPHGDVTHKFAVRISGVMPSDRAEAHSQWEKDATHKKALRYESMADAKGAIKSLDKDALDKFRGTPQSIVMTIEADYILIDDANSKKTTNNHNGKK
jgi:hypothetical protein